MKKLKKFSLNNSNVEVLGKREMKMVVGGYSSLNCGTRGVELCKCSSNVGTWYQCKGSTNVAHWACNGGSHNCNPV